jgi:chromate reductase, NAD(P)H dehydrogenase (quinone)
MSHDPSAVPLRILGIAGSLRRGSFNRALLRSCAELAPASMEVEIFDGLGAVPPYDQDLEAEGDPPPVRRLKEAMAGADGLLIATPEYNYSVPGVLKNALDWASRPPRESPLREKPVGIVGASGGGSGTMRAQLALRQVFVFTGSLVLPKPEVYVTRAPEKFSDGRLTDEATREHLTRFLSALEAWVGRWRDQPPAASTR